jgi:YVTN family beta-propeller protein
MLTRVLTEAFLETRMMRRQQLVAPSAFLILAALVVSARGQYLEATIPVGDTPYDLLWNPTSNKVYCANEQGASVTVISGSTNGVLSTIGVAEYPIALAWNSRNNKVYCASGESNRLTVIDGVGDTVITTVAMSGFPNSMVYNSSSNKLYVTCYDDGRLRVLDGATDEVVASIAVGEAPLRPAWNPISNRVFCPVNYPPLDSIAVIDCQTDQKVSCFAAGVNLKTVLWDPLNGRMYVTSCGRVQVVNATGDSVLTEIVVEGYSLDAVAFGPYANRIYVGDWDNGKISVIDGNTQAVVDTFRVPQVHSMLCDTVNGTLYCHDGAYLRAFDAIRDTAVMTLRLHGGLGDIEWNAAESRVYASAQGYDVVYVIRDTTTGIVEENRSWEPRLPGVTLVRGVMRVGRGARLVDVTGRIVVELVAGENDVSRIARGAYSIISDGELQAKVLLVR